MKTARWFLLAVLLGACPSKTPKASADAGTWKDDLRSVLFQQPPVEHRP